MRIAPNAPQPHNLLGIWYELNGKRRQRPPPLQGGIFARPDLHARVQKSRTAWHNIGQIKTAYLRFRRRSDLL